MKRLVSVLFVAAVVLFTGNVAKAQQKIGHINSAELLESMPEMVKAKADYEAIAKGKQAQIEAMVTEYQTQSKAAEAKYKTLSEANKEAVTKELNTMAAGIQDLEKRINDAKQKAQEELGNKQNEIFSPIYKKAEEAVRAVSKEKGFAYVFDTTQQALVYFDGGEDILAAVKAKLGITGSSAPKPAAPAAGPKKK